MQLLVIDLQQGETVGGGAMGGFLVSWCIDEVVEIILSEVSLGCLDGGSGEEADHFVEKAVTGEGEEVVAVDLCKVGAGDGAGVVGVGGFIAAIGGEGPEVVFAEVNGEGLGEVLGVELAGEVPGSFRQEGREDGLETEVVGVGFGLGGKAGVKVVGHFFAFENTDGGREFGVERGNPVEWVHREVVGGVEVGDLAEGVDAGVGASGAVETDRFFGDFPKGFFDEFLDGNAVGLNLPTGEGSAVIGDGEFEVHYQPR